MRRETLRVSFLMCPFCSALRSPTRQRVVPARRLLSQNTQRRTCMRLVATVNLSVFRRHPAAGTAVAASQAAWAQPRFCLQIDLTSRMNIVLAPHRRKQQSRPPTDAEGRRYRYLSDPMLDPIESLHPTPTRSRPRNPVLDNDRSPRCAGMSTRRPALSRASRATVSDEE